MVCSGNVFSLKMFSSLWVFLEKVFYYKCRSTLMLEYNMIN